MINTKMIMKIILLVKNLVNLLVEWVDFQHLLCKIAILETTITRRHKGLASQSIAYSKI